LVAVPSIGRAGQPLPQRAAPGADATRRLYEEYGRQILAYCQHQLGNREEAEDATQSTFLNAFRGLQRGVHPEFELAWLYKIAQNVCLTRLRTSSRRRRLEAFDDLDAVQDVVPAREVDSDELIGLPKALEEMPKQQQRALLLREWQGLSYREIAAEMNTTQAAVETLIFRARRTLAAGLADEPKGLGKRAAKGGDAGSFFALLKSLLFTGGAKVAATLATVAATSVVAGTPITRHAVENAVVGFTSADTHRVAVHHAPSTSHAPAAARQVRLPALGERADGAKLAQQAQRTKQGKKAKRHDASARGSVVASTVGGSRASGVPHSELTVPDGDPPATPATTPAAAPVATPAPAAPAAATPVPAAASPPAATPAAAPAATPTDTPVTGTSTPTGSSGSGSTTGTTNASGGSVTTTSGGSGGTSDGTGDSGSGSTQTTPPVQQGSPPVATQPVQPIAPVTQVPAPTTTTPTTTTTPPTTTTGSPPTLRPTPPIVRRI
jgi:RNA polymerase sigma-70 factor (ECF subfamily)